VDVLHLDIGRRAALGLQQEIDPRGGAVTHLAPHAGVAGELRNAAGGERLGDQTVRQAGVDPDQAAVGLDQPPRPGELAGGIGRARQPDPRARRLEAQHRPRVGAMRRRGLARRQEDVGEEALVAPHQGRGRERF